MQIEFEGDRKEIIHKIKSAKKVCIFTHKNPDGDAIGSSLAVAGIFKQLNTEVAVIVPNEVPDFLKWIPNNEVIKVHESDPEACKTYIKESDLMFLLDFSVLSRVEEFEDEIIQSDAYKIHIDHHPGAMSPADVMINFTKYSATAELLYWFLCELDFKHYINETIATCLYVGISTDTGNFNHNSSVTTFQCVAELLETGIDRATIQSSIYDNYSYHRMRLLGYCLNEKLTYIPELNTGYIAITKEELEQFNHQIGDTEGFVNYPLSIKGVKFSALFIEQPDLVKISLRSKGNFAVNEISNKYFNGGGHKNAAGGRSHDSLDEVIAKFREVVNNYAHELKS